MANEVAVVEVKEILRLTTAGKKFLREPSVVWRSKHQSLQVEISTADGFVAVPIWATSLLLYDKREGVWHLIAGACAPVASVSDGDGNKLADVTWPISFVHKHAKTLDKQICAHYTRNEELERPRFATGDVLPVHVYVRAAAELTAPILHNSASALRYESVLDAALPPWWTRDPLSRVCATVLLPTFCCRYDADYGARGVSIADQWMMPTLTDNMGSVALDCEDAALFTVAHWYSLLTHGSTETRAVLEKYTLFFIVGVILDDLTAGRYAHAYCLALPPDDDAKLPPLLLDGTTLMDGVFDERLRPDELNRRVLSIDRDTMQQPIPAGSYASNYEQIYIAVDTSTFETYSFDQHLPVQKFVEAFRNGSLVHGTHRIPCDDECARLTTQWGERLGFGALPPGSSCFLDCAETGAAKVEQVFEAGTERTNAQDNDVSRDWYICREADFRKCHGDDERDLRIERRCVLSSSRGLSFVVASLRRSTSD